MAMSYNGRLKELMVKYGKVALGVHFSVSAASIAGLYLAIQNNVDVQSLVQRFGLSTNQQQQQSPRVITNNDDVLLHDASDARFDQQSSDTVSRSDDEKEAGNRTLDFAASSGGALALAVLLNKALIPVRIPITVALTPVLSRFLARRKIL